MSIKKDIIWRIYLAFFAVCLLGVAIMVQTVRVQYVEGDHWRGLADSLTTAYKPIEAERGNLLSDDGRLLATSLPFFEVRVDLRSDAMTKEIFYDNVDSLAYYWAAKYPEHPKSYYLKKLKSARESGNRYFLIRKKVSYPDLQEIKAWPLFNRGRYKGGLIVLQKNRRVNPYKMLAHRTIGYKRDGIQPVGLEGSCDEYLSGLQGKRLMQKISGGTWIPVNDEDEISSENGKDVVTTIDINLQDVVENALLKAIEKHRADHGTAIVMEVKTGKIRAIANVGKMGDDTYWEKYNYAVGDAKEPGSTQKLASLMALLEDGYVDLSDSVDLENGRIKFYDRWMKDSDKHDLRNVTVQMAFEISSNTGVSKLVNQYYSHQPEKYVEHLRNFGLNQKVGLEIKGEAQPFIKEPTDIDWSGITLPWMSVGYELTQTPIQTLAFYNAIANDGYRVKPYLVQEIQQYGQTVEVFEPQVSKERICSKSTLEKSKVLLEGVVLRGTGDNLHTDHYGIAGKTGTAQVLKDGRYQKVYQASFVGYFPADDPQYSCIVVVNAPRMGVYYGGWVAGPVFREIADKVYANSLLMHAQINNNKGYYEEKVPYLKAGNKVDAMTIYNMLGVSHSEDNGAEWVKCEQNDNAMNLADKEVEEGYIADVRGMGLRDALYLLENEGLDVSFEGRGKVRTQSILAGTKATKGRKIHLVLR